MLAGLVEQLFATAEFGLSSAVETATGWFGLVIIFVYSFLIAFALPGVSEVVLFAPLDIGLGYWGRMTVIIIVSSIGKTAGSVFAFHIGQGVRDADTTSRLLDKLPFDVENWSRRQVVKIAQRYGYAGLAVALSVPGFPDTLSLYAFSVLEESYVRFTIAALIGSAMRLVVTLVLITGVNVAL